MSLTDRCNLRCRYCMPREIYGADHMFLEREELLSFEEIARLTGIFAAVGVTKLRLTGGEPLLRRNLECLVEKLASVDGIEDIALTTNGLLLAGQAARLANAGLGRVTVSLDALEPRALARMSDAPIGPQRILEGIDAAQVAGLSPIKVNMVVRRGVNDHCIVEMAEHFRHRRETLRFIEYMDVGSSNGWRPAEVVTSAEILAAIDGRWPLEPVRAERCGEVATRYRYLDGAGEVGFVSSISQPFCGGCNRARLSADGKLFKCLFARAGYDLRGLLRGGAGDLEIARHLEGIWAQREDRYSAKRSGEVSGDLDREIPAAEAGSGNQKVEMSYIGG